MGGFHPVIYPKLPNWHLIGDQRARYNAASDGRSHASGRDKKSYCLCDTQEDQDGVPQYARDGGVTYIALEFSWPDGGQVETWGMRIDYSSAETQTPEEEFFRIPERMKRSDFITPDGHALDLDGFRLLLRAKDGETYRNVTEYRKRLAEHLNFDRQTVDFLMPSAMSFAFLPRFDEFCRRYILQAEDIKIEPVQQSYRSYLRIREELEKLHDKAHRLAQTVAAHAEWDQARADSGACRLLEAEFARSATRTLALELQQKLQELDARLAVHRREFDQVTASHDAKKSELESLKNLFRDEGGAVLLQLKEEIKEKVQKIERFRQIGQTVEEERDRRVGAAADFAAKAEHFLAERNAGTAEEFRHTITTLQEARPEALRAALRSLAAASQTLRARLRQSIAEESQQSERLQSELQHLQAQLKQLEFNRVMPSSPLLDELNKRLPRRGRDNPARQLRELCEVADEEWRPALELAFTRKFAVVVSPEDYPEALRIYKELAADSPQESLVDPGRALARKPKRVEDSLASKVTSEHPVARAVLDDLFGGVACVRSLDDLRKHPDAIMPDGFRQRGLFAERPRRYDERPCIGAKGIERLKALLQARADECGAKLRTIEPILTRCTQIERMVSENKLDSDDIEADIHAATQLRDLEAERDRLIERRTAASTPELDARERAITELDNTVVQLDQRRLELHGRLQSPERNQIARDFEEAGRKRERAEKNYDETVTALGATLQMNRCEALRSEFLATYPTDETRAAQAGQRYRELESRLPALLDLLQTHRQGLVDQHPDLRVEPDFDPATEWNDSYRRLLDRIQVEDMPTRQQQAREEEQRWQELFRTTVAARLSQALGRVRDTIRDLNYQLKKPIGDSQYHIRVDDSPSREFQDYRRVLEACAITRDGDSLFAALDADARDGVERIFKALVDEPDGKLAREFLDYRSYFRYDMEVSDPKRPELPAKSLNRHADKFSGGEKQTPFYISILACYLRAYKRHLPQRYTEPSLGLVPIDEAFSKMSGERITDAIRSLRDVDLQGILSMSSGNWPYAIGECDQVLAVHQREAYIDGRKSIRNLAALLTREQAMDRAKDWE